MSWWDDNYTRSDFRSWLTNEGSFSRSILTDLVRGYDSVLDCACGTCLDYFEYKKKLIPVKYKGIDSCKGLVDEAKSFGIDCDLGSIEELPYKDGSFDIVTARHILEHLDYYEKALSEMCRVAKYEVAVIFFLPPQGQEVLEKDPALKYAVNINKYGKKKLEEFASQFGDISWVSVGSEVILRIKKRSKKIAKKRVKPKKIGVVCSLYIDNDTTYQQAIHTLDTIKTQHKLVLYGRITKLSNKYKDILKRFDNVAKNSQNLLAKSWNNGIQKALKDGCEYVIVPNLDIELKDDTIDNLVEYASKDDSVVWSGWCTNNTGRFSDDNFIVNSKLVYDNFAFFMVNDRLFKEVGKFDEKFIPAYGEDVDMQYRLELAGKKHTCVWMAQFVHFGQTTIKNCKGITESEVKGSTDAYFIKKWGGLPRQQVYLTPFNK